MKQHENREKEPIIRDPNLECAMHAQDVLGKLESVEAFKKVLESEKPGV